MNGLLWVLPERIEVQQCHLFSWDTTC
jgi:hypothetical protein